MGDGGKAVGVDGLGGGLVGTSVGVLDGAGTGVLDGGSAVGAGAGVGMAARLAGGAAVAMLGAAVAATPKDTLSHATSTSNIPNETITIFMAYTKCMNGLAFKKLLSN